MGQKQLTEDNLKKVDGLRPIAEELGCSLAQLALAWAASNPDVSTVITGATKPQQARVTRHEDCSFTPLALLRAAEMPSVCRTAARMDLQFVCKH
jgi:diketogulonate reductase-like aldo/keto reductase